MRSVERMLPTTFRRSSDSPGVGPVDGLRVPLQATQRFQPKIKHRLIFVMVREPLQMPWKERPDPGPGGHRWLWARACKNILSIGRKFARLRKTQEGAQIPTHANLKCCANSCKCFLACGPRQSQLQRVGYKWLWIQWHDRLQPRGLQAARHATSCTLWLTVSICQH